MTMVACCEASRQRGAIETITITFFILDARNDEKDRMYKENGRPPPDDVLLTTTFGVIKKWAPSSAAASRIWSRAPERH